MAARSVLVKFVNKTDSTLSIDSDNCSLQVGEWATKPPESISAQSTGQWESESDSYDDGTVGHCHYIIQDGTDTWVSVNWSNPFSAPSHAQSDTGNDNLYKCMPPDPGSYQRDDHPTMVFTLTRNG